MARRILAIDSSIAVKWFSEEDKTAEALALRDSHIDGQLTILTTQLLSCEVANALRFKPGYDHKQLSDALKNLLKLHLLENRIDLTLLSRSAEIAFKCNVTIYDAIPVAVAVLNKTKCVTADRDTQYSRIKPNNYPIELL
ncbi:MAG TPA: type II toxin-antitoxin system VapC family toxin [Candidatus Acidoferrales bacterium]|nr:type II toxin-antitoxin system VapC family toxin [Candidatus Acidoferrales bacterium]